MSIEKNIERIADALEALAAGGSTAAPEKALEKEEKPKRKRTRKKKEPAVSEQDVRAKLKELLDERGKGAAMDLLDQFDAARLGDVDEADYPKLMAAAEKALAESEGDDLDDL